MAAVWRARKASSLFARAAIRQRKDCRGEQSGVLRAGFPDRERADRDAGGHLHDRKERILTLQRACSHRHAEHRERGHRRRHAGQMRGAAGAGDHDLEALGARALGEFVQPLRCAMSRYDQSLMPDLESIQRLGHVLHHGPVGLAAHDDRNGFFAGFWRGLAGGFFWRLLGRSRRHLVVPPKRKRRIIGRGGSTTRRKANCP